MKIKFVLIGLSIAISLALGAVAAAPAQDKYTLQVPGGLAFSEFKGYESWQVIASVRTDRWSPRFLDNPAMIAAFKNGTPANGKPFPDGARMAKVHWAAKKNVTAPGPPTVGGAQHDVDFMVKDSKRFADSGGWGYAVFKYDAASDTFMPGDLTGKPPQGNDAKCGFACHTIVKDRDFVFTELAHR